MEWRKLDFEPGGKKYPEGGLLDTNVLELITSVRKYEARIPDHALF